MNIIGSVDRDHFISNAEAIFAEHCWRAKITAESTILDIGAGCGRLAYPYSYFLSEAGRYHGCDVWDEGMEICRTNFANFPNMFFNTIDANNSYYFEDRDKETQNNFTLDFLPDKSIEFAFAISVFTHLVRSDCEAYFRELSRVLEDGGLANITCFIIDDFFFEYRDGTGEHVGINEEESGCYYGYGGQDFFGGFTYERLESMLHDSGLLIISKELGSWANKPSSRGYQDNLYVVKG